MIRPCFHGRLDLVILPDAGLLGIGPDRGAFLVARSDVAGLPPPETTRWVSRRKAQTVAAIEGGLLTADEACARYRMSREELANWQRLFDRVGVPGLRATRIQYYREAFPAGYLSS